MIPITMDFIDLKAQYHRYRTEIDLAIAQALQSAAFIQGPPVVELEARLSDFTGSPHVISCSSGTDALLLSLMAAGLQRGDEVIVPDFTFFATAEVVAHLGARPIFADIDPQTWNIDPQDIQRKITKKTKGIIPVSLFGQCADMISIGELAKQNNLWVLEDATQSFGASHAGLRSCNLSLFAATSFYPSKPLGCYGDGGAVFCQDSSLAQKIRSLMNHGQEGRYQHTAIGLNGRLDTIQAAILLVKLKHYEEEFLARNRIAQKYQENLKGFLQLPTLSPTNTSAWAQFTVSHPQRDHICESLRKVGIPTSIHYPIPLHQQPVFAPYGINDSSCPVATETAKSVFSLPMHPFLEDKQIDHVCTEVVKAIPH